MNVAKTKFIGSVQIIALNRQTHIPWLPINECFHRWPKSKDICKWKWGVVGSSLIPFLHGQNPFPCQTQSLGCHYIQLWLNPRMQLLACHILFFSTSLPYPHMVISMLPQMHRNETQLRRWPHPIARKSCCSAVGMFVHSFMGKAICEAG